MTLTELWEALTHHRVLEALAGAAGAIVYVIHEGKELSILGRVTTVISGMLVAHFLTHPVIHLFNIASIDDGPGTGFVLGLFGMSLTGAAMRLVRSIDWSLVKSFFPGGKQ